MLQPAFFYIPKSQVLPHSSLLFLWYAQFDAMRSQVGRYCSWSSSDNSLFLSISGSNISVSNRQMQAFLLFSVLVLFLSSRRFLHTFLVRNGSNCLSSGLYYLVCWVWLVLSSNNPFVCPSNPVFCLEPFVWLGIRSSSLSIPI